MVNWIDEAASAANAMIEAAKKNDEDGVSLVWRQLDEPMRFIVAATLAKFCTELEEAHRR